MSKDKQIQELKETIEKAQKQIEELQKPEFKVGDKVKIINGDGDKYWSKELRKKLVGRTFKIDGVNQYNTWTDRNTISLQGNGYWWLPEWLVKVEQWKPNHGESYYCPYFDEEKYVCVTFSNNSITSNFKSENGLCFKTKEEAIEMTEAMIKFAQERI